LFKTREEILALSKRRYGSFEGIRFQSLTEAELSTLRGIWAGRFGGREENSTAPVDLTSRAELLAATIVDESGNRMFANDEVDLISTIDSLVSEPLHKAIEQHCGLTAKDDKVDKLEKKSASTED
jgi:hypothetical protein